MAGVAGGGGVAGGPGSSMAAATSSASGFLQTQQQQPLLLTPDHLIFSAVRLGTPYRQTIQVTNTFATPVELSIRTSAPERYTVAPTNLRIEGNGTATVAITLRLLKFKRAGTNTGASKNTLRDVVHIKSLYFDQNFHTTLHLADDAAVAAGISPRDVNAVPTPVEPAARQQPEQEEKAEAQPSRLVESAATARAAATAHDLVVAQSQRENDMLERIHSLERQLQDKSRVVAGLTRRCDETNLAASTSRDALQAFEQKCAAAESRHKALEEERDAARAELAQALREVATLSELRERATHETVGARDLVEAALQQERSRAEERNAKVLTLLSAKDACISQLEEEVRAVRANTISSEAMMTNLRERLRESEAAREMLDGEKRLLKSQVTDFQDQARVARASLESAYAKFDASRDAEATTRAQKQAANDETSRALEDARRECALLRERLHEESMRGSEAERNVEVAAAEASRAKAEACAREAREERDALAEEVKQLQAELEAVTASNDAPRGTSKRSSAKASTSSSSPPSSSQQQEQKQKQTSTKEVPSAFAMLSTQLHEEKTKSALLEARVKELQEAVVATGGGSGSRDAALARLSARISALAASEGAARAELESTRAVLAKEREAHNKALATPTGARRGKTATPKSQSPPSRDQQQLQQENAQLMQRAQTAEATVAKLNEQLIRSVPSEGSQQLLTTQQNLLSEIEKMQRHESELVSELSELKDACAAANEEAAELRVHLAESAREVATAHSLSAETQRELSDMQENHAKKLMELTTSQHAELSRTTRKATEAEIARDKAERSSTELAEEKAALTRNLEEAQAQLSETRAALEAEIRSLQDRLVESRSVHRDAKREAKRLASVVEERAQQISVLMETVEALQGAHDTAEAEQRVIALTAQLAAAKAVEGQLEMRATQALAEVESMQAKVASVEEQLQRGAEKLRTVEGERRAAARAAEISAKENVALKAELREARDASSSTERDAAGVRQALRHVEGVAAALRSSLDAQRKRHFEELESLRTSCEARVQQAQATYAELAVSQATDAVQRFREELSAALAARVGDDSDAAWAATALKRVAEKLEASQRELARTSVDLRLARAQKEVLLERAQSAELALERCTDSWQTSQTLVAHLKNTRLQRESLRDAAAAAGAEAQQAQIDSMARALESASKRLIALEREEAVLRTRAAEETAARAASQNAASRLSAEIQDLRASAAAAETPESHEEGDQRALREYLDSTVGSALLKPGTDERLLAFTRELCALKLSEREALRRLGVAQRRFDAAQVASGELRVANDRLEKQLVSLSAQVASNGNTVRAGYGDDDATRVATRAEMELQLATQRQQLLVTQQEAVALRTQVHDMRLERDAVQTRMLEESSSDAIPSSLDAHAEQLARERGAAEARAEFAEVAHEMEKERRDQAQSLIQVKAELSEARATIETMQRDLSIAGVSSSSSDSVRGELEEQVARLESEVASLIDDRELRDKAISDLEAMLVRISTPSGTSTPDTAAAEMTAKQLVRSRLAEADAQRKIRVAARMEMELRQVIAKRESRIAELKKLADATKTPLATRTTSRTGKSPTPNAVKSIADASAKKKAAVVASESADVEKVQQELSQTKIDLYRARLEVTRLEGELAEMRSFGRDDEASAQKFAKLSAAMAAEEQAAHTNRLLRDACADVINAVASVLDETPSTSVDDDNVASNAVAATTRLVEAWKASKRSETTTFESGTAVAAAATRLDEETAATTAHIEELTRNNVELQYELAKLRASSASHAENTENLPIDDTVTEIDGASIDQLRMTLATLVSKCVWSLREARSLQGALDSTMAQDITNKQFTPGMGEQAVEELKDLVKELLRSKKSLQQECSKLEVQLSTHETEHLERVEVARANTDRADRATEAQVTRVRELESVVESRDGELATVRGELSKHKDLLTSCEATLAEERRERAELLTTISATIRAHAASPSPPPSVAESPAAGGGSVDNTPSPAAPPPVARLLASLHRFCESQESTARDAREAARAAMARLEAMELRQRDLAYAIHARHEEYMARANEVFTVPSTGVEGQAEELAAQLATLDEQHVLLAQRIADAENRYIELQRKEEVAATTEAAMRQQAAAANEATAAAAEEVREAKEQAKTARDSERALRRALNDATQGLALATARQEAVVAERERLVEAAEAAERAWTAERAETQERHDAAVAELKEEHVAMLEAAQEEFASKLREELESAEFRARHDVRTAMEESLTNTVDDLSAKSAAAEARAEAAEKAHSQLLTKTRAYAKLIRDEFELYKTSKEKELKKLFAAGMSAGAESSESKAAAEASAMDIWEALRGTQADNPEEANSISAEASSEPESSASFWYHPTSPAFFAEAAKGHPAPVDDDNSPTAARAVMELEREVQELLGNLRTSQYTEAVDMARRETESERQTLAAKKVQLAEAEEKCKTLKAKLKAVEGEYRRYKTASKRDLEMAKTELSRLREVAKGAPDAATLKSQNSYLTAQLKVVRSELGRQRDRASALTEELKENKGDEKAGSATDKVELSSKLRRANFASVRKDAVIVSLRGKVDQLSRELEEARSSGVGALEDRVRILNATIRRKDQALQSLRQRFDTVAERAANAALAESGMKTLKSSERIRSRFAEINSELQNYKSEMASALASAEEASKNELKAWQTLEADVIEMKRRATSLLSALKAIVTLVLESMATANGLARDMTHSDERSAFARLGGSGGGGGAGAWTSARGLGEGNVAAASESVAILLGRVEAELRVLEHGERWSAEDLAEVVALLDREVRISFQALSSATEQAAASVSASLTAAPATPPASDLLAQISAEMNLSTGS